MTDITRREYRQTLDQNGDPTAKPVPKVIAATSGSAVGGAAAAVGIWIVETTTGIDIPSGVESSIVVLAAAVFAFAAGYLKRP